MDAFASLLQGLAVAVQPGNLLFALIGVLLGTAVGVLPGIGPALTVALLLPITYKLDPGGSLIMFAGIYYGGMYGGSTTAILINTPGESASMATALEGNKMAKSKEWAEILKQKGWDDAYLSGDQFAAFLKQEQTRVTEVLKSVGLVKS